MGNAYTLGYDGKPIIDANGVPAWHRWILDTVERRVHELPDNTGPDVARYATLAKYKGAKQHLPWCALLINAGFEVNAIEGTHSASSQSFRYSDLFIQLPGPALGAVAVFWRTSRQSGLGHVGLYCAESKTHVLTLSGNEHDMCSQEWLAKQAGTFGLIGYWWPASVPRPTKFAAPVATVATSGDAPKVT